MQAPIKCKHCGSEFTPKPGKPGFINECLDCLEERRPKPYQQPEIRAVKPKAKRYQSPANAARSVNRSLNELMRLMGNDPELQKIAENFRKSMKKLG